MNFKISKSLDDINVYLTWLTDRGEYIYSGAGHYDTVYIYFKKYRKNEYDKLKKQIKVNHSMLKDDLFDAAFDKYGWVRSLSDKNDVNLEFNPKIVNRLALKNAYKLVKKSISKKVYIDYVRDGESYRSLKLSKNDFLVDYAYLSDLKESFNLRAVYNEIVRGQYWIDDKGNLIHVPENSSHIEYIIDNELIAKYYPDKKIESHGEYYTLMFDVGWIRLHLTNMEANIDYRRQYATEEALKTMVQTVIAKLKKTNNIRINISDSNELMKNVRYNVYDFLKKYEKYL